jgi:hypothetical protein
MSIVSRTSLLEPCTDNWRQEGRPWLAEQFCNVSQFLRGLHVRMRFGEHTRAPLHLLRFNILGEIVKCDWLARSPDPWDDDLSEGIRKRHASLQTLKDAINVRVLLFETMPHVETADLRVYRETSDYKREMIITGCVQRNDHSSRNVHSIVMRAKVLGFRFYLEGDTLLTIASQERIIVDDSFGGAMIE